jgi:hypothetical protein
LIGAVIFVIFFLVFTLVSVFVYPDFPPAAMILGWFGITAATIPQYGIWIVGLINGVIYGFLIWLLFSMVNLTTQRGKKGKTEKTNLATCPKCKTIVVADKTWNMTTRPSKTGKRTQMEIGLFNCPQCGKTFRRMLSKKDVY